MTAIGSIPSAATQSTSIEVAKLAQDQQKAEGQASVSLIQKAGQVQGTKAPVPAGDGTGRAVDVYA
jgi:hypothetical protein